MESGTPDELEEPAISPVWQRRLRRGSVAVLLLLGLYGLALYCVSSTDREQLALAGDAFAPFTALLTAGALFVAAVSVFMQSHELKLQRRELREAREELKRQGAIRRTATEIEARKLIADLMEFDAGVGEMSKRGQKNWIDLQRIPGAPPPPGVNPNITNDLIHNIVKLEIESIRDSVGLARHGDD
ncbi:MAG: hypothetical protein AAGF92_14640 [Myxococcota bacterium]